SCNKSVLLPTPGSPPTSVTEPGTIPPPSTRSSSANPVGCGLAASMSTSPIGTAAPERATGADRAPTCSASSVFHAPQPEHCPAHFGCALPQSEHTCASRVLEDVVVATTPIMTRGCHSPYRVPRMATPFPPFDGSAPKMQQFSE